ncbi:F-box/LRR-repeat protein 15-like protein [Drosera capensis]
MVRNIQGFAPILTHHPIPPLKPQLIVELCNWRVDLATQFVQIGSCLSIVCGLGIARREREEEMERGKERVIVGDDGGVGSEDLEDNDDLELDFHLGMPGSGVGGGMRRDLGDGEVRRDECGQEELLFSGCQPRYLQFVGFGDEVGDGSGPSKLLLDLMDTEDYDGDLQNKRPKFDSSSFAECNTSSADSHNITTGCSFNDFRNSCFPSFPSVNNNVDAAGPSNGENSTEENGISMDLSDDLLHMVFSFLGPVDLCRAAMVCKQWRTSSTHEDFWRLLDFSDRDISVDQFEDICRRYPRATEVSFSGSPAIHLLAMRAVSLLRNLQVLTLGKGSLGEAFFLALKDCQMLKCLIINDATLANSVQDIAIHHDRLQHLQITKCRVLRVSVRCPQLETLSLKRSKMAHAALTCPLLRDLDIGSCHKLSDAAVRAAVASCPLLEILDISNCSCVTDETLREIALVCANLRILDASYCPNISLESVRLSMLTDLKLASCDGITSASMAAISHSYMLEELDLDNCSVLTSVSLDLSHLRNISLVHCRKLVDLSLRCLKLSSLTVLNSAALNHVTITSNGLKKLILKKQESLTSLSLQCPYLQEVDLSDCESLTNSICEVFSDGGGCPMLRSLYLDNCESLAAVGLQSTSLVSLSLAGCRGIISLDLKCPYLQQVRLDCCDHLEQASFGPVALQSLNLGICPKLEVLSIDGPQMVLLELKGCGVLSQASINCPMLTSLDASFCCQLQDDCLSATTSSCPQIESLILMSCPAIGSAGLFSLQWLRNLTYLDLSYTFLTDLHPIYQACTQLKVIFFRIILF